MLFEVVLTKVWMELFFGRWWWGVGGCFCCVSFFSKTLEIFNHNPQMSAKLVHGYACAYQESRACMGRVCVCVCVCVHVCHCVCGFGICCCCHCFFVLVFFCLHVKALLKALVYMISWITYNVMDALNVVMVYLVIISDAINEFLPGDNKDLLY